jgi:hypothetical protein
MIPFLISQFAKEALSNLVKECFGSDFPDILTKPQVDYIFRYLTDLGAESVLLESEYVDRDYLDDYSKFYARQFSNRGHMCARLHFFACPVSHALIEATVLGKAKKEEQKAVEKSYLGFIVVRPLPRTFIGRTCLKGYPDIVGPVPHRRLLSRSYTVSLFGMSLTVDSVAFQEQDKVVAACATTAIWSSLHATSSYPITEIPSLSQITSDAINFIPQSNNGFPNKELSTKQILRALDVRGLRHHAHNATGQKSSWLMDTLRTYLDSEFSVLLVCRVGRFGRDMNGKVIVPYKISDAGGHAVTVVGYKAAAGNKCPSLYVHDDRTGPFARATVASADQYDLSQFDAPYRANQDAVLELQHKDSTGWQGVHEILVPTTLIVATPRNVRVPADTMRRLGRNLGDTLLTVIGVTGDSGRFSSEATLRTINEIKAEFRLKKRMRCVVGTNASRSAAAAARNRLDFLTRNFARYQWCLDIKSGETPLFRVVVDATDVSQGDAVSAVLYSAEAESFIQILRDRVPVMLDQPREDDTSALLDSFVRRFTPTTAGLSEHLDRTFGPLRAPTYLKGPEVHDSRLTANGSRTVFYERSNKCLDVIFPDRGKNVLIWVIDHEGALVIGIEQAGSNIGHPALTGSKPARIAGELKRGTSGGWAINGKSGRYSGDYANKAALLVNAIRRFEDYFGMAGDKFIETPSDSACAIPLADDGDVADLPGAPSLE